MSWQALDWVRRQRVGHAHSKAVLVQLANLADECGSCFPSHEYLAEQVEVSERTIYDCMKRLETDGYVDGRRDRLDSGRLGLTRYTLRLDREPSSAPPEAASAGPPEAPAEEPPEAASGETLRDTSTQGERECAREVGKEGDPSAAEALLALRKDWPDFALESQERSLLALSRLSPAERQTAVERVPDFLVFHREKRGKARLPYLHNYLAEKRWEGVPQQVKAVPKAEAGAVVKAFSRAWWWCFVRYVEIHGEALRDTNSGRAGWLRIQVSKSLKFATNWPIDRSQYAEIEAQATAHLTRHPKDGEHARRWKAHYQFEFNVAMPLPDQAEWVWLPPQLPSTGPPTTAVETVERDMATEGV